MYGSFVTAYIGLGSNLGNREENLAKALAYIKDTAGICLTAVSAYIETKPVGYIQQPDFLNAAAAVETLLSPHELLNVCNGIEEMLKRKRTLHWGPRTIDLDILLFGNLVLQDARLIIPHPRMMEREFVLRPLAEIAPEAIHPVSGRGVKEMYMLFLQHQHRPENRLK
jgi:2-amino-4-hydroxy-6-hydroxymethyldihydropteridine diphosphokinase